MFFLAEDFSGGDCARFCTFGLCLPLSFSAAVIENQFTEWNGFTLLCTFLDCSSKIAASELFPVGQGIQKFLTILFGIFVDLCPVIADGCE